ncbi:hypothetical protein VTL71DRAFT_12924 [Oculimacula yallundae]|uniref:Uncharacterized protein n=1 Tax=Oculimacula yallundae TaxID=86028 RepID=A0ABR4CRI7_9HELO
MQACSIMQHAPSMPNILAEPACSSVVLVPTYSVLVRVQLTFLLGIVLEHIVCFVLRLMIAAGGRGRAKKI